MKYQKTVVMVMVSVLIISFFMPWFSIDTGFTTFESSGEQYNGISLLKGIRLIETMISGFGSSYGINFPSQVVYLGYLIVLIPLLGIIALLLMGKRKPSGLIIAKIQIVFSFFIALLINVVFNYSADMRELVYSILDIKIGFILLMAGSLIGIFAAFIKPKKAI